MELVLEEINKARDLGLNYVALAMALTLPDVCAYLEISKDTQPKDYKNWCRNNLDLKKLGIDENTLYVFRCRLSHNASLPSNENKKYLITYPTNNGSVIHNNIAFGQSVQINLDYNILFDNIIEGVKRWCVNNENNSVVRKNMESLLKVGYPDDFPIKGIKKGLNLFFKDEKIALNFRWPC